MADGIRRYFRGFVLVCAFSSLFTYFSGGRGRRPRGLYVNFRSFRLFNFFDVHISGNSRTFWCSGMLLNGSETGFAW